MNGQEFEWPIPTEIVTAGLIAWRPGAVSEAPAEAHPTLRCRRQEALFPVELTTKGALPVPFVRPGVSFTPSICVELVLLALAQSGW